jgi:hypothetical protein
MAYLTEVDGEFFMEFVAACERLQDEIEAGGAQYGHQALRDPLECEPIEITDTSTWSLDGVWH